MPATRDVGANITELRASKTKRPPKQILAIALDEARRAGNTSVKAAPSKKKGKKGAALFGGKQANPFGRGADKKVPGKPGMVMETEAEAKKEHDEEATEPKVGRGQASRYTKAKHPVGRGADRAGETPAATQPPARSMPPGLSHRPNLGGMRQMSR